MTDLGLQESVLQGFIIGISQKCNQSVVKQVITNNKKIKGT